MKEPFVVIPKGDGGNVTKLNQGRTTFTAGAEILRRPPPNSKGRSQEIKKDS